MNTTNMSSDPNLESETPETDAPSSDESGTKEQAQQAAGTAKEEGKRVADVAKQEAQSVADEAKNHARGLLDDATSQVQDQSKEQKDRLAQTVRTFGEDLDSMTSQGEGSEGLAARLVAQAAQQARSLATHLEDREPRELLDDVRRFARRRPGTFLLGALAAGVVVGRLTRGAKAAQDQTSNASAPTSHDPLSQDSSSQGQSASKGRSAQPTPSSPAVSAASPASYEENHEQPPTDSPAGKGLGAGGAGGVELSESGIVGPDGGRA